MFISGEKMERRVYLDKNYVYDIDRDLEIYFRYGNSIVFSTGENLANAEAEGENIRIVSYVDIEDFYSVSEANRYCRSEVLAIQGIITFFTGVPFVEYSISKQQNCLEAICIDEKDICMIIGENDYSSDLERLLDKISSDEKCVISLLDRWRKACYLYSESVDANLYHDEAILDYFHIIELLAETSKDSLKIQMENSIKELLKNFYIDNLAYTDKQIDIKIDTQKVVINKLLVEPEMSIAQKSKCFLKKYELFDDITSNFIDALIATRNAIAHGRKGYEKIVTWPVPPFFCLSHESYEFLQPLCIFTAKLISSYLGLNCWNDQWEVEKMNLLPIKELVNEFLKKPTEYFDITVESLCEGNKFNITWEALFSYYIKEPKKFSIQRIGSAMKDYYLKTKVDKTTGYALFDISVILCDSDDYDISIKAMDNVKMIIENQWYICSNYKDIYGYLEYMNLTPTWYREFLLKK